MTTKELVVAAQNEIIAQDFPKVANREWAEQKNEHDFFEGIKGIIHSKANGFDGQVDLYKMECLDIIHADRADHALALAKKHRLKTVQHLFNHELTSNNEFRVSDKNFDWLIKPVSRHGAKIPLPALETLTFLRQNGVDCDGFGIGIATPKPVPKRITKPAYKPVQKPRRITDPVLLIRFGRYWLEIFRWD